MKTAVCCKALALVAILAAGALAQPKAPSISADDLAAVKSAEAARVAVIEKVYGAVVAIYGNDRQGGGSGVLYDPAGYALTNHHVVAAAGDEGWAGLADGKLYRWKLLGTDPGGDVAIIRLEERTDFPAAPIGDSETVRVGDWSMAMGNPFVLAEDQRPTVTLGIVSGVHRYQPGSGLNTLVYGNCIQVDSSINPGNSGGPLFNLRGEVIGINGRGSFEERGRVNVGLGYAISSNQVKHFIPDLLATRVAQHGTLDAQFGNRAGGVICQTINLNAPIVQLGLALGDRLVAFEGVEITSANQFTNIISTYPADWPCEVTFEHEGERKTVHVRLTALPYDLSEPQQPMPPPIPGGDGKPAPRKPPLPLPDEPKPVDEEKPAEPEKPMDRKEIRPVQIQPQRVPLEPGKVRFPELMRESTAQLIGLWHAGVGKLSQAIQVTEQIVSDGDVAGEVNLTIAADGRFLVRIDRSEDKVTIGFDGASYWRQEEGQTAEAIPYEKAARQPLAGYAMAMAAMLRGQTPESISASLEGGDKAQRQIAYRLALATENEDPLYVWLSAFDADGSLAVSLLKTGAGFHDDEPIPSLTYHDWQTAEGLHWPHRKVYVKGLAETPGDEVHTRQIKTANPADDFFRMPSE